MKDITYEEFVQYLISAGWTEDEARREADWNFDDGDIDGDMSL